MFELFVVHDLVPFVEIEGGRSSWPSIKRRMGEDLSLQCRIGDDWEFWEGESGERWEGESEKRGGLSRHGQSYEMRFKGSKTGRVPR